MGSVPYGNPGGVNQTAPQATGTVATPAQISGGCVPSSSNPYMFSSGTTNPSGSGGGVPTSYDPNQQNLQKQWTDIYGQGTGSAMLNEYNNLMGTNSAAFQALQASMAPVFAQQNAQFGQGMGAAGVGPNSTVQALGLSNLLANQGATLSGADASMIMQNQQERLGLLQGTEQASAAEVAQRGWGVFGQVAGAIGNVAGAVMGMPGIGGLFGGGGTPAGLYSPSVTGVNTQPELSGDYSIPSVPTESF